MAAKEVTYESLMADLEARRFAPVYYLMGEEPYYIDRIADYLADNVLTETEKEFNFTMVYGADTDTAAVINLAKMFPMMSEWRLVVVKEAQLLKDIDQLAFYLERPQPQTILVLCHKHGTLDRRKKLAQEIQKKGVLFESKKVRDKAIPQFILSYLSPRGLTMGQKALGMMTEYVGSDLSRLVGELDKLALNMPQGSTEVTPEQIEENIGISKDYNDFELRDALIRRDVLRANRIVCYFAKSPKQNPIQRTLATLFNYFSNLMMAYYAPQKDQAGVAQFLGVYPDWRARDYMDGMRAYSGIKTMQIISAIRATDARSKGVENSSLSDGDLLRELVFFILH